MLTGGSIAEKMSSSIRYFLVEPQDSSFFETGAGAQKGTKKVKDRNGNP